MRDGRTNERRRRTREDKATQPLDAGRLSFAIRICLEIQMEMGDHDPDRGSELGVVELVANVRGNEATTN